MATLSELQQQIRTWHFRNFPHDDAQSAIVGIGEECGELNRCQLKQDGKIRGTWGEWQVEKGKEIGDVVIGLLNLAGMYGISVDLNIWKSRNVVRTDGQLKLMALGRAYGQLCDTFIPDTALLIEEGEPFRTTAISTSIYRMLDVLNSYANLNGYVLAEAVADRWATISKRDFVANPVTGGREKETTGMVE